MKNLKKALIAGTCSALLVAGSVAGTMAYLTAEDSVKNTFTVGDVQLKLDEANVDENGALIDNTRVEKNDYHLMPGHDYIKDPTVTILKGSELSYIRMLVTINRQATLDEIFAPDGINLDEVLTGRQSELWVYKGDKAEGDTRVYELRYVAPVSAKDADLTLNPLFRMLEMPEDITAEELRKLNIGDKLTIDVVAQAIQADGFVNADAAWDAFDEQN